MRTQEEAIEEAVKCSIKEPEMYFTVKECTSEYSDGEITSYSVGEHLSKDITVYPSESVSGVYRNGKEVDILQCNFTNLSY